MLAHRLRGTAGSYGFREIGAAAGRLEDSLAEAGGPAARSDSWEAVDVALGDLTAAVANAHAPVEAPESGASLASGRLLAVSRDADFFDQVTAVGRQHLYQVACASSAEDARAQAGRAAPDAVFLDLGGEESVSLARELRALKGCEQLALAFVSPTGATPDRIAAAHAGASLFLERPVDADELAAAARQLVSAAQASRPKVLVVDDDEAFAKRACAVLDQRGIGARHLAEPARILEVLEEVPPDLVLLDVVMPGLSGFDVCRMLRATPPWPDLPVVMVPGQPGAQARITAFQCGADDYLNKPVLDEELLARVQVRVDRARLMRERYDKDGLTGLLLRRPLVEALRARLLEGARHGRALAIALIDFDGFKRVNDTHGHLAGDAVLATFGKLLARRFRAEDLRGRWGGEEFLLAFPGEGTSTILGALQRLQAEFSLVDFKGDRGEVFRVSFCVGIAGFPEDGAALEDLIRCADRRMYQGKMRGGHKVVAVDE
jgi:diguanylate cyclase (GGDEF)-like protein